MLEVLMSSSLKGFNGPVIAERLGAWGGAAPQNYGRSVFQFGNGYYFSGGARDTTGAYATQDFSLRPNANGSFNWDTFISSLNYQGILSASWKYNDKFYKVGGSGGTGNKSHIVEYDPSGSGTWINKGSLGRAIWGSSAIVHGDKVFIFSGYPVGPAKLIQIDMNDFSVSNIDITGYIPEDRFLHSFVKLGNKGYVSGGRLVSGSNPLTSDHFEINLETFECIKLKQIPLFLGSHAAYADENKNKLLLLTGMESSGTGENYNTFYFIYDIASDNWESGDLSDLIFQSDGRDVVPGTRQQCSYFTTDDNSLLISSGVSGSSVLGDVWKFKIN